MAEQQKGRGVLAAGGLAAILASTCFLNGTPVLATLIPSSRAAVKKHLETRPSTCKCPEK